MERRVSQRAARQARESPQEMIEICVISSELYWKTHRYIAD